MDSGWSFYQTYNYYTNGNEIELPIEQWQGQEYVKVQIHNQELNLIRVLVKGTGDIGYEKIFKKDRIDEVIAFYESLIALDCITLETVNRLGMTQR